MGIANGGYWGIPVRPNTTYHASFYARGEGFFRPGDGLDSRARMARSVRQRDGLTSFRRLEKIRSDVENGKRQESKNNRFVLTTTKSEAKNGTLWLQNVSLVPAHLQQSPERHAPDIMQLLADMQPKFLRFPGGNYVEGNSIAERFNWKETIGDVSQRPGHPQPVGLLVHGRFRACSSFWSGARTCTWSRCWRFLRATTLDAGSMSSPDPQLEPYVQEALEEIEYVTGDAKTTKWGAQRAKDGHPKPFHVDLCGGRKRGLV